MPRDDDLYSLPVDLPVPHDDGACRHLTGLRMPRVTLVSTAGRFVNLGELPRKSVLFFYPRMGHPNKNPPAGWNEIPGARGCTPQACGYRDWHHEFQSLGATVFGISSQPLDEQCEASVRLALPFELLHDVHLELAHRLRLPTFQVASMMLIRRVTLVVCEGQIEMVFYPVFPPNRDPIVVLEWLGKAGH